jgi:endonuclease/exonuclease/phosphatase family metal-dependent hydrolase
MKLLTLNTGGAYIRAQDADPTADESYSHGGRAGIEHVIAVLKSELPDVIVLQESHTRGADAQADTIAQALHMRHVTNAPYDESHIEEGSQLSLAIISKWPLSDIRFELFKNPGFRMTHGAREWYCHDKGVLSADVTAPSGTIRIATTHLVPFKLFGKPLDGEEVRAVLADVDAKLCAHAQSHTAQRSIVTGDFNLDVDSIAQLLPQVSALCPEVVLPAPTTPKGRRYDRVFARGLTVVGPPRVLADALTDHYPAVVEFEG